MMKYIEELSSGDVFEHNNSFYILTIDFKKNNERLCISLKDGSPVWTKPETIVTLHNIYTLDKNNNIIPIKETKK